MSTLTRGSIKGRESRSATLRAPTTPHAIRQKPPPKPPRLSSSNVSTAGSVRGRGTHPGQPDSPGGNSTKSSFGNITLDSSFCSVSDIQPVSRVFPCQGHDKVCHIITQTRDFLTNELDLRLLMAPLLDGKILDYRSVAQLKASQSREAQSELFLDLLTTKSYPEFVAFCEILQNTRTYSYLGDLLLALDSLVDLGSEDTVKKRQNLIGSSSMVTDNSDDTSSTPKSKHCHNGYVRDEFLDMKPSDRTLQNGDITKNTRVHNTLKYQTVNGDRVIPFYNSNNNNEQVMTNSDRITEGSSSIDSCDECPICLSSCHSSLTDDEADLLMDTSSYDVELLYVDRETGQPRSQKEVTKLKLDKLTTSPAVIDNKGQCDDLLKHEADRYQPVVTVSLYNYCLYGAGMMKICQALRGKDCVRELSLSKCHIDVWSVGLLSRALSHSGAGTGVNTLDLRLNPLPLECVRHLTTGIGKNTSVKVLNLSSTSLSSEGTSILLASLCGNQTTAELDIGFNDLSDKGCCVIAEALATSSCPLKKLRIRDNGIGFDGAFRLFKALKKNSRLTFLDISSNQIGDRCVVTLSELLRHNRSLKQLNVENCGLGAEGCKSLSRALKSNTVLKLLNLSMNSIGDAGLIGLSEGLKYNPVLDVLCLNMCQITNTGFYRLLDNLQFNMTLKTLKLCYNKIGRVCSTCKKKLAKKHDQCNHGEKLDCNSNNTIETEDEDCMENSIPSIEEVYDKLCMVLQQNQDLKVLLWGNKLEEPCALGEEGQFCCLHTVGSPVNDVMMTSSLVVETSSSIDSQSGSDTSKEVTKEELVTPLSIDCKTSPHVISHSHHYAGRSDTTNLRSNDTIVPKLQPQLESSTYQCTTNQPQQSNSKSEQKPRLLNQMQKEFIEQYTIHNHSVRTADETDKHTNDELLDSDLWASIISHNSSFMNPIAPDENGQWLSVSIPNHQGSASSFNNNAKISPRMGTSLTASNASLPPDFATTGTHQCSRIRTNGSLPYRLKQNNSANVLLSGSAGESGGTIGSGQVHGEESGGNTNSEYRPHTFPRRKKLLISQ